MAQVVRPAGDDDHERLVALTAEHRRRLADWSPVWWRVADDAADAHSAWLRHLIRADGPTVRVLDEDNRVVGCAVAMPQRAQWFIDDIALDDEVSWRESGVALLNGVQERRALTCVPSAHTDRIDASKRAGLAHVSSYWIRPTAFDDEVRTDALPTWLDVPSPPPHTFGGALDPNADGALTFSLGEGFVVGSPSVSAPPVYDPGGKVCVIDRVIGGDRAQLIRAALSRSGERGDVLVNIVAGSTDQELNALLEEAGFERTVDVYEWPETP